jgi:hypothetical protein
MTRERFKFIFLSLACEVFDPNDPDQTTERPDSIQKIRSLVDTLRHHFDESTKPPKDQSIEEEMVLFKGRSVLKSTERSDDQKQTSHFRFQIF